MGFEDRDYYREAHRQRELERMQSEAARWRFRRLVPARRRPGSASVPAWIVVLFWVCVAVFAYGLVRYVLYKR